MSEAYDYKYELKRPVEYAGEIIGEVAYNEPRGRQWRKLQIKSDGGVDQSSLLDVFAACSNQAPPFFDYIYGEDYVGILTLMGNFISDGPPTG